MSGSSGRGLRGGSYTVTKDPTTTTIDYQAVRFSGDHRQGTLSFHGILYTPSKARRASARYDRWSPGRTPRTDELNQGCWPYLVASTASTYPTGRDGSDRKRAADPVAGEQPDLFSEKIRAAFRSLRQPERRG